MTPFELQLSISSLEFFSFNPVFCVVVLMESQRILNKNERLRQHTLPNTNTSTQLHAYQPNLPIINPTKQLTNQPTNYLPYQPTNQLSNLAVNKPTNHPTIIQSTN